MKNTGLLILGGGASGLAAAIEAARSGADVTVLEKLDRVGKKILATGNGRCNLLNLRASSADYNDPAFAQRVFAQYDVQSNLDFFRSMGLLTTADAEGRVYPRSGVASSVLDVLRFECARLGVQIVCGEPASSIRRENGAFVVGAYRARAVIVACARRRRQRIPSARIVRTPLYAAASRACSTAHRSRVCQGIEGAARGCFTDVSRAERKNAYVGRRDAVYGLRIVRHCRDGAGPLCFGRRDAAD